MSAEQDGVDAQRAAEIGALLSGVVGVVEANSFEQHMLWVENGRRVPSRTWRENNCGLLATIGQVGGLPVCLSLMTATVDGHKLLFVHATSRMVDYTMIDEWLLATLPASAIRTDGYVNKVDAMNFCNVFRNPPMQKAAA